MEKEPKYERPKPGPLLNITLFCTALFSVGGLALVMEKPTYSELERRDLAAMPELTLDNYLSGEFFSGVSTFYSDTFPFRDALVSFGSTLEEMRGLRLDDARIHEVAPSQPEPSSEPSSEGGSSSQESSSSAAEEQPATGEQNGSVFIYQGRAMSMFGGSQAMGKYYADVINAYAEALPDVKVYDIIVPTSIEFYLPERYQDISAPEKPNIDYIYSQMSDAVTTVDAYSEIAQHTDEYIYFRTDHHWTVTGAYYAYVAFCEAAGFTPTPYDSFEWNRKEPFYGTLYSQTQDSTLYANPDYVDYPTISTPHPISTSVAISIFSSLSSARRIFRPASWKETFVSGSFRSPALSSPSARGMGGLISSLIMWMFLAGGSMSPGRGFFFSDGRVEA